MCQGRDVRVPLSLGEVDVRVAAGERGGEPESGSGRGSPPSRQGFPHTPLTSGDSRFFASSATRQTDCLAAGRPYQNSRLRAIAEHQRIGVAKPIQGP